MTFRNRNLTRILNHLPPEGSIPAIYNRDPAGLGKQLLKLVRSTPQSCEKIAANLTDAALSSVDLDQEVCQVLYPGLIEPLCDDFSTASATGADMILEEVIKSICRHQRHGSLARHLKTLSNNGRTNLSEIKKNSLLPDLAGENPERLLFLSRVSAGADVMITSVIMARLKNAFPTAEIHLIAPANIADIFSAPDIHHHPIKIKRHGSLNDRISFWPQIAELARELLGRTGLVVDPETRLTQLGLLPLAPGQRTLLFASRTYGENDKKANLAELANRWLDELGCPGPHRLPEVHISSARREKAKRICQKKRANPDSRILLINLGVGGDTHKRMRLDMEIAIIHGILEKKEVTILLDSGRGMEEKSRVETIIAACGDKKDRVLAHNLDLGEVAALIAESDAYLGYDSSCQHLAAAVGTPALTMFKGFVHKRFLARWSPGAEHSLILPIKDNPGRQELAKIITAAIDLLRITT